MRLLYQLNIKGKAVQYGVIAGVPMDGDLINAGQWGTVCVLSRFWDHATDHDATYDSQLNKITIECEPVE